MTGELWNKCNEEKTWWFGTPRLQKAYHRVCTNNVLSPETAYGRLSCMSLHSSGMLPQHKLTFSLAKDSSFSLDHTGVFLTVLCGTDNCS